MNLSQKEKSFWSEWYFLEVCIPLSRGKGNAVFDAGAKTAGGLCRG
jgi:hypothetical protein